MPNSIRTAEFVSPGHPDKQCDFIVDSLLDKYMAGDPNSRCAIEMLAGHKLATVTGEVTSGASFTRDQAKELVQSMLGDDYEVRIHIEKQSQEIAQGVDTGGAGDQGIMNCYATS